MLPYHCHTAVSFNHLVYGVQNQKAWKYQSVGSLFRARLRHAGLRDCRNYVSKAPGKSPRRPCCLAGVGKNGPLYCLLNRRSSPSEPLYRLMGNCCSGAATVPSSPSPPSQAAGSVTPAPVLSPPEAEDALAPSPQPRSRTESMPKPRPYNGVSSQYSSARGRAVSEPQRPQSKSSVTQNAITRPRPVAAPSRDRFDHRTPGAGESDD